MNQHHAEQIAQLLNSQNLLVVRYDAARVLKSAENYLYERSDKGAVVACVELKRVQWYQFEIDHLTVDPNNVRTGLARKLLKRAEERAKQKGGRILQCTIRENNKASQELFRTTGFVRVSCFHYPTSGNNVDVWQKVISPAV
jgi:N-acetylglutamate synthase-like GNAT family acetyltransferase